MQQLLTFWPLHLLELRVVAIPCYVRLYAVEDGRHGRLNLRREEVSWYSDRYLRHCRGMDVVVVE
jgi:hypothetical protein